MKNKEEKNKETNTDNERFLIVRDFVMNEEKTRKSIGVLSEKTLHAVLKNYYEPDRTKHEIKVEGYVADIFNEDNIIEIQIGNLYKMREKLSSYLKKYNVKIIYPVVHEKYLIWVEENTNRQVSRRKSPKKGNYYSVFKDLYRIKNFLKHSNISFKFVLVDIEEYRKLDGWGYDKKRGSHRIERIPTKLVDETDILSCKDYKKLIPKGLPEEFTTKDYAKIAHVSKQEASVALNILFYIELVKKVGKKGNSIVYMQIK